MNAGLASQEGPRVVDLLLTVIEIRVRVEGHRAMPIPPHTNMVRKLTFSHRYCLRAFDVDTIFTETLQEELRKCISAIRLISRRPFLYQLLLSFQPSSKF